MTYPPFLTYLLVYLILGLITLTGAAILRAVIARESDPTYTWRQYGAIIISFLPLWPVFLLWGIFLDWKRWCANRTCYWCGEHIESKPESITAHFLVCEKSPMSKELRAARKVCEWVDTEMGAEKGALVDWKTAGESWLEWDKAKVR